MGRDVGECAHHADRVRNSELGSLKVSFKLFTGSVPQARRDMQGAKYRKESGIVWEDYLVRMVSEALQTRS